MKKIFESAELTVVKLTAVDIITASTSPRGSECNGADNEYGL